jgi:hypothetical protein
MVAALTRDMPAHSLLVMVGMPISAPARRDKTRMNLAPRLCRRHHNPRISIIDSGGMIGTKR